MARKKKRNEEFWTADDSAIAESEGWNLFAADGHFFEIERIDEKDVFADDREATRFVFEKAAKGSILHLKALCLDGCILKDTRFHLPTDLLENSDGTPIRRP